MKKRKLIIAIFKITALGRQIIWIKVRILRYGWEQ